MAHGAPRAARARGARTVRLGAHRVPQDTAVHQADKEHVAVERQRLLEVVERCARARTRAHRFTPRRDWSVYGKAAHTPHHGARALFSTRVLKSVGVVMRAVVGSLLQTSLLWNGKG